MDIKKMVSIALGVPVLMLIGVPHVSAATTQNTVLNVEMISGGLNITYSPSVGNDADFGKVNVDGTVKNLTANLGKLTVADNRGTGEGWHVNVTATKISEVGGTANYSLPAGSLLLKPVASTSQAITRSLAAQTSIDSGSSVLVASAGVNQGTGNTDINFSNPGMQLNVDTSLPLVDTNNLSGPNGGTPFNSTVTWAISTGP